MGAPAPLTLQSRVGGILYHYMTPQQLQQEIGLSDARVEGNTLVITIPD